jgi:CMP-N,N'-diacetyllegionaminic acid synthase
MEILAIVPARGGSRGIPRKNLALIDGIPLVAHSIRHALESSLISRVIVSTEDEEILQAALAAGAEVPFRRPVALAGDEVLDHPVFEHVLRALKESEDYTPDVVVHLRPTAPFRRVRWIDEAIHLLVNSPAADSVRSVSRCTQHPYRMFRIDPDGFLDPVMKHEHPLPYLLRRQELAPVYYYNCILDVTRPRTIFEQGSMTGAAILPYVIPEDDVIDVDTARDLEVARFLMGRLK